MRVPGVGALDLSVGSLAILIRRQSVFAVCEICKGIVIIGIGDIATADQCGEAIVMSWHAFRFMAPVRSWPITDRCRLQAVALKYSGRRLPTSEQ